MTNPLRRKCTSLSLGLFAIRVHMVPVLQPLLERLVEAEGPVARTEETEQAFCTLEVFERGSRVIYPPSTRVGEYMIPLHPVPSDLRAQWALLDRELQQVVVSFTSESFPEVPDDAPAEWLPCDWRRVLWMQGEPMPDELAAYIAAGHATLAEPAAQA